MVTDLTNIKKKGITMPLTLTTPTEVVTTTTELRITKFENNIEEAYITIDYISILDGGTEGNRGSTRVDGVVAIKDMYTTMDTAIATGKTFEEASKEVLYGLLAEGIVY